MQHTPSPEYPQWALASGSLTNPPYCWQEWGQNAYLCGNVRIAIGVQRKVV